MEAWTWLVIAILAAGLLVAFVHAACFMGGSAARGGEEEGFELEAAAYAKVVDAFFEAGGDNPTVEQMDRVSEMADAGELDLTDQQAILEAVRGIIGAGAGAGDEESQKENESDNIELGEPSWVFGKLGFTTITVPYRLKFPPDADGGSEAPTVLKALVTAPGRSTFVSSASMGGVPAPKRTTGPNSYEFTVLGDAVGEIKLTQSDDQASFSLTLEYRGEKRSRYFEAPEDTYPPDDAESPNVRLGPVKRVNARVRIPFEIAERREGEAVLRVMWRAPPRTTFFNEVEQTGLTTPVESRSVGPATWETTLFGNVRTGTIELQQTPGRGGAPPFTVWAKYGDDVTAVRVPEDLTSPPESPGDEPTLPDKVTPVLETVDDMVDLDAFPHRTRQPVETRVVSASPRIQLEIPTSERVSPSSEGYVLRVPFRLRFADGEVPEGSKLRVTWDLDPATTQVRHLVHARREIRPTRPMESMDAFEAVVGVPAAEPSVLVLDQPLGRRAITLTISLAGETSKVMLAGSAAEPRGAGFVGSKRPIDFQGNPQIRFTDVHESAEQRVVALYRTQTGAEPDEQTTKFLMSKYFEWDGDLGRVANLASTISTVVTADPDDDEAGAVQRAVASLEAGATPGQAKEALKHWKEYETHRAMWRPDQNQGGYPGATALKRPWADEAVLLAEGHSSDLPAVAANSAGAFDVSPGQSQEMIGQGHWMFS